MVDLNDYLKQLEAHLKTRDAREHTYRPALISLFESFYSIQAANDQARTEHGQTDFVYRSKTNLDIIVGYGEAKDVNVSLDKTEKSEQMERYSGYSNLLLTNGLEFRFYKNGKRYAEVEIAKLDGLSLAPIPANFQFLIDELSNFLDQAPEKITSAKRLSQIMGAKARRIRSNINILLKQNQEDSSKAVEISKIYQLMKNMLVADMSSEAFADMYAQTLVYGLFVARYSDKSPESFSRSEARDLVPHSNPFLRHFFDHIAGAQFETRLAIIVDELCEVFQVSDISEIINKYLKLNDDDKQGKDPVIHFYEDFLSEYDPAERKKMGAYYTPLPVVDYMVRAVDEVLKNNFDIKNGLADSAKITKKVTLQGKKVDKTFHRVQVLDPATGTATFLNEIIKFVHSKFKGQEGMWPAYAKTDLIPRLSGFELMMGAYTIAHLKLGLTLKNLGVDDIGDRLGVYLTNSLEEGIPTQPDLFNFGLAEAVTEESSAAAEIKSERPIMVIIGNPPYSGESSNKTKYADSLIDKYRVEPGGSQRLQERNYKWLSDDYVKFIAFAEDLIEKNGEGVLAFITNHGYLDNPTFRGMRWHLSQTFDEIKIIDLHGNAKKKEVAPDGTKDENVFDIQQGVAIVIATKLKGSQKADAKVSVSDIYGKRLFKFSELGSSDIKFKQIKLDKKLYYFAYKNTEGKDEYEKGFSISELFMLNSVGVVTAADGVLVSESEESLNKQLVEAKNSSENRTINKRLKDNEISNSNIVKVSYRPFDDRYLYYVDSIVERPRKEVMKHFLMGDNVGTTFIRNNQGGLDYSHIFISDKILDAHLHPGLAYTAPLWLYDEQGNKSSNLNHEIVEAIKLKAPKADEQAIFDYIYGVLHWPEYRVKYKEFLKIDFPRVPYPKNQAEFDKFRAAGERLRQLHLMQADDIDDFITTFSEPGSNTVERAMTTKQPGWVTDSPPSEGCPKGGVAITTPQKDRPTSADLVMIKINDQEYAIDLPKVTTPPSNSKLKDLAKQNRKAGVLSEVLFWQQAHKGKFHKLDFDRQRVIGDYIVDFYVKKLGLVVEIDGSSHDDRADKDEERQKYLEGLGLKVFRVNDSDVKKDIDSVMRGLEQYIIGNYTAKQEPTPPLTRHPSEGGELGKVWINDTQYFGGVPKSVWEFYIGGYQPAQKWLKDRRGRELSFDDITHYQRIIKVLDETRKEMEEM